MPVPANAEAHKCAVAGLRRVLILARPWIAQDGRNSSSLKSLITVLTHRAGQPSLADLREQPGSGSERTAGPFDSPAVLDPFGKYRFSNRWSSADKESTRTRGRLPSRQTDRCQRQSPCWLVVHHRLRRIRTKQVTANCSPPPLAPGPQSLTPSLVSQKKSVRLEGVPKPPVSYRPR